MQCMDAPVHALIDCEQNGRNVTKHGIGYFQATVSIAFSFTFSAAASPAAAAAAAAAPSAASAAWELLITGKQELST